MDWQVAKDQLSELDGVTAVEIVNSRTGIKHLSATLTDEASLIAVEQTAQNHGLTHYPKGTAPGVARVNYVASAEEQPQATIS